MERGFITPRELWDGVKLQVEEIVRSLFSYSAGVVHFWEGEIRPDNVVRLSLPTRRLIAEGLRRRDQLIRFLAWLESPLVRLEQVPDRGSELTGVDRAIFQALEEEGSFLDVCRRVAIEPLAGARTLQHLRLQGSVRTLELAESEALAEVDTRVGDDDAVRECVHAHVKLMAELAAPVVAVEGGEALRGRMERVAQDARRRYPELLAGLEFGANAVVDPEPLIERALRIAGERERELRLALGELISYLEFELLNHPQVPDPEEFLEAIEPLRANL